jgi:hypothetical protein
MRRKKPIEDGEQRSAVFINGLCYTGTRRKSDAYGLQPLSQHPFNGVGTDADRLQFGGYNYMLYLPRYTRWDSNNFDLEFSALGKQINFVIILKFS